MVAVEAVTVALVSMAASFVGHSCEAVKEEAVAIKQVIAKKEVVVKRKVFEVLLFCT
jgi:hypothetical protein